MVIYAVSHELPSTSKSEMLRSPAQHSTAARGRGEPPRWERAAVPLMVVAGAAWFLHAEHLIAGRWGYSLDDSWIYATFARNLASGQGYAFNPGEHVAGATGPLYVFILALLYSLFRDVIWPAKILGLLCLCASCLVIYETMRRIDPTSRVKPLLAGLLVAVSPPLLWGSLSGMEIPVYLLLACLGVYFYVCEKWTLAVLCWSVGIWLRPDGLFLVLLGLLVRPKLSLKNSVGPATAAALVIGACLGFNYIDAGRLLPNSVAVKTHFGGIQLAGEWSMVKEWADLWGVSMRPGRGGMQAVLLLPAMVVGALTMLRRLPAIVAYVLFFPLVFALSGASGGQFGRYIVHVIPFGVLLAVVGLGRASQRALHTRSRAGILVLGVLCLGWQAYVARKVGVSHGWNVQNINGMHRYVAEATRRATSPGDTVAVNDVGAMGYFSGCYVVDLVGLVSPRRPFPENLSLYKPKYLVIFPDWFQTYAAVDWQTDQVVFYDADSTYKYSPFLGVRLRRNTIASRNTMYLYERMGRNEVGARRIERIVH